MAQPSNAVLLTNPVRPNDLNDAIPSAFAIDIKGGHHMYKTLNGFAGPDGPEPGRNQILEARREWGMLCTVFDDDDSSLNGTYQLVFGKASTDINDNRNWVLFKGSPQEVNLKTLEWDSSVINIVDTPPGLYEDGDRYLIKSPGVAQFFGREHLIAEWSNAANNGSGDWMYFTPTNGTTVRIDNLGDTLYRFVGTWSQNGYWKKEYINQIKYISPTTVNNTDYNFITPIELVPLHSYDYSTYYANFNSANTGSANLQIDNLGSFPMKKIKEGTLTDLEANDLKPNNQYHISWNVTSFLVHGIAGPASGVIGPAEDLTGYTDGLYVDFTPNTPIGTPIDRFNEILKSLVPKPAPDLEDWSLTSPTFVNGKLSIDSTNVASFPPLVSAPGVSRGGDFNSGSPNSYRKGINSFRLQPNTGTLHFADYRGRLNYLTGESSQRPTPAYAQFGFGNADTGILSLRLNGQVIVNADLTNLDVINTTNNSQNSGLILSAATSSKFPSSDPFEVFYHRTGEFLIKVNDSRIQQGYNYLDLSHILPGRTINLPTYTWFADPSTFSTTFTNISLSNIQGSNPKSLSGIQFYQNMTVQYNVRLSDHVRFSYNSSADAIKALNTIGTPGPSNTNGINQKITTTTNPIMANPDSKAISVPGGPSSFEDVIFTFNTVNSNVRRLNEGITFSMTVARTVQGIDRGGTVSDTNFFIDNVTDTNSLSDEKFTGETFRLLNGVTKYTTIHSSIGGVPSQPFATVKWDSTKSLFDDTNHRNGLQIINGQLVYPRFNYSQPGPGSDTRKNPNYNKGLSFNYSNCPNVLAGHGTANTSPATTYRTYTRYFRVNSLNNFQLLDITIEYTATTFVSVTTPLTQQNCWIEVKLPKDPSQPDPGVTPALIDGAVTGWMDMFNPYRDSEKWANGAGAYAGTRPSSSGQIWKVAFGGKGTGFSGGYVVLRITASNEWTGHISSIKVVGGV
jgi:hypothetical protein